MEYTFDKEYVLRFTEEILKIDSPTGFTKNVMTRVKDEAERLGFSFSYTNKGNGIITVEGKSDKYIGLCAHVDTLGLMVRSIKDDGSLAVTCIGGPILPTLDGEYCKIYTRDGKIRSGTILSKSPAAHVYKDATSLARSEENLNVRLDERVKDKDEVKKLGITAGDFICIDPKTVITENDFIKSRFLDDKLSVGVLFGVLKYLKDSNHTPVDNIHIFISTYEETGHGMSCIPADHAVSELIAVDMGCIGDDLSCTEYDVSICPKDSTGPYDYELTNRLIELASVNKLDYAVDIYPYYGSDVSAALSGGNDIRGALIGPGVHASHGMERSHYNAVENTMKLIALFIGDTL